MDIKDAEMRSIATVRTGPHSTAQGEVIERRYGNVRVQKIYAAIQQLAKDVRSGNMEAAQDSLDRVMPWVDWIYADPLREIEIWAQDNMGNVGRDVCAREIARLCEEIRGDTC